MIGFIRGLAVSALAVGSVLILASLLYVYLASSFLGAS